MLSSGFDQEWEARLTLDIIFNYEHKHASNTFNYRINIYRN